MSILDDLVGRVAGFVGGADLRRAAEAEAGGDYLEAARAYAAAGDRAKVAEMNLLASERAPTPDDKLECLREAARWSGGADEPERKVRRRVAAAMLKWVRARGLITEADRRVAEEAGALFQDAGDAAGAAECHELLGAREAAALAYQAAGEVDRLEQLLDSEADRRRRAVATAEAVEDHRLRLRAGDPAGALRALELALAACEPRDRAGLAQLRDALAARRLPPGRLVLTEPERRTVIAAPPVVLGRAEDATLPLRDAGVSRHHAELRREAGVWVVADRGSRNGTTLGGVPLGAPVPLPPAGELGLGDRCALAFSLDGDALRLELTRGLDRGVVLHAGEAAIVVPRGAARLVTRFVDGRARVRGEGAALFANGASVGELEPLADDALELDGATWKVVA